MDADDFRQIIVIFFCSFISFIIGVYAQKVEMRKEAIKIGVAYYTSDENGYSTFKWINE